VPTATRKPHTPDRPQLWTEWAPEAGRLPGRTLDEGAVEKPFVERVAEAGVRAGCNGVRRVPEQRCILVLESCIALPQHVHRLSRFRRQPREPGKHDTRPGSPSSATSKRSTTPCTATHHDPGGHSRLERERQQKRANLSAFSASRRWPGRVQALSPARPPRTSPTACAEARA